MLFKQRRSGPLATAENFCIRQDVLVGQLLGWRSLVGRQVGRQVRSMATIVVVSLVVSLAALLALVQ